MTLADEWERCREWLLPAMDAETTEEDVICDLEANRAQIWPGERSACVTQLYQGPEPYLLVWLAGGKLRDLLAMQPGVEAWCRAQGVRTVRVNGRKGWARALRHTGFEPDGDELRKAI